MKVDVRHNLMNIGDIFVDAVQKTADTALQCSKRAFLTYDINKLTCKKRGVARDIGERVTQLVKEGSKDVTQDAKLAELIANFNNIEKIITEHQNETCAMVNPFKKKSTGCEGPANNEKRS